MTEHAAALKLIAAAIGLPGDASPLAIASDVIRKLAGTRKNGMGIHLAKYSGFISGYISELLSGKKNASPEGYNAGPAHQYADKHIYEQRCHRL